MNAASFLAKIVFNSAVMRIHIFLINLGPLFAWTFISETTFPSIQPLKKLIHTCIHIYNKLKVFKKKGGGVWGSNLQVRRNENYERQNQNQKIILKNAEQKSQYIGPSKAIMLLKPRYLVAAPAKPCHSYKLTKMRSSDTKKCSTSKALSPLHYYNTFFNTFLKQ